MSRGRKRRGEDKRREKEKKKEWLSRR